MKRERPGTPPRAEAPTSVAALMSVYTRVSVATENANPALVAISNAIKMSAGSLSIGYQRGPDYFAASRESGRLPFTILLRNEDKSLSGTTSLIVRDAQLAGVPTRYGYFCDLRTLPSMERATWRDFVRYYEEAVRYVPGLAVAGNPEYFLTTVIDSNERALRLLRGRLPGLEYRPLAHYEMVQSFFRFRPSWRRTWRKLRRAGVTIRRASLQDATRLREFLASQHRQSAIGEGIEMQDGDELSRRLETWSDFSWDSFWLALDANGKILGCVAPRQCRHRRAVLSGLGPWRRMASWATQVFGARPIRENEPLDLVYLSHFEVAREAGPEVARALVLTAHRQVLRGQQAHALCWLEWKEFPETHVPVPDFACVRTRGTLYQVLPRDAVGVAGRDLSLRPMTAAPILDVSTF